VLGILEGEKEMVDITANYIDHMGSDLSVVNAARVSFGKKSEVVEWVGVEIEGSVEALPILSDRDNKLIKYLAKHRHISPFGHAFASFHVCAPIFVARQLVKHKFLRWNEVSKRYVDDTPELYEPQWRSRSADKKQGSGGPMEISLDADMMFHATCRNALTTYDMMIEQGVAPEQARSILPQNMMTEWYWSGSLDAFASMCGLRCKPDTQYESQLVANQIDDKMAKLFPVSWEALRAYEE
jgi:thymidylate synthase (FAD)